MTKTEAMRKLKEFGTEQNRKVYARHGVSGKIFGVSYANLGKLKRECKTDHTLAIKLWETGNHDARILATMIANPDLATSQLLDAWVKDLSNYVISDAFSSFVSQTKFARKKMEKWTKSKNEWIGRTGWLILAHLVRTNNELRDTELAEFLKTIERNIHSSKNRIRDAMNSALIAMGIYRNKMERRAVSAAKRIGKVEVDHGETNCKTPDAESYIKRALERQKKSAKQKS